MFSDCFSGVSRGEYRTSPHKQRIDHLTNSLLKLRYAPEVIRQRLHEWLRFSLRLDKEGASLPAPSSDSVKQYLDERVSGRSASRSRVLRASVRIFLEADEQGHFADVLVTHRMFQRGSVGS